MSASACIHAVYHLEYMTDQRYSSSSSSSELHSNSNKCCSFSAQPPICTIDILTPEHSQQTRHKSTPAGQRHWTKINESAATADTSTAAVKPFKPLSLPKFVKGSNVHTFLKLFDNSMFGATEREKATTVINCLDTVCVELVMPHLPAKQWS